MTNYTNEIKNLSTLLAKSEMDGGKRHLWSSIEPKRNQVEKENEYLDILARLLVKEGGGGDKCIAVFLKGEKLFVASNKDKPANKTKDYLSKLKKFAEDSTLKNYLELLKDTVSDLDILIKTSAAKLKTEVASSSSNLDSFSSAFAKFRELICSTRIDTFDYKENLESAAQNLLNEVLKKKEEKFLSSFYLDYLSPFNDLNIIANAIVGNKLPKELLEAIRKESIKCIDDENLSGLHAEVKLVVQILSESDKSSARYIGISKLTCAQCSISIGAVNSILGFKIDTCGTHGGSYNAWLVPDDFPDKVKECILTGLRRCRHDKVWESSSKIGDNDTKGIEFFSEDLSKKMARILQIDPQRLTN